MLTVGEKQFEEISFSNDVNQLEEINLPPDLAASLAGQCLTVEVLPEEEPRTRRPVPDEDWLIIVDAKGNIWNVYRPMQLFYTDAQGRVWRLPRHWLAGAVPCAGPQPDACYEVTREHVFSETVILPSVWDLVEINVPSHEALEAARKPAVVEVRLRPHAPVQVFWRDGAGGRWRIPHVWRCRRIRLPTRDVLVGQGIPSDVATSRACRVVSTYYHPGSLCCWPEHYHFRDEYGDCWPVRMQDCFLLGYGDAEHLA